MADDAKINWGGSSKDAQKAIEKLILKVNKLESANRKMGRSSKKNKKETVGGIESMITKYAGLASGIGLATAAVTGLINEQQRQRRITDDVNRGLDDQKRLTNTQLEIRLGTPDSEVLDSKISELAVKTGQDLNFISQGFEAASSGGLSTNQILNSPITSSIITGLLSLGSKDMGGDVKSFVGFLSNSGLGKTEKGVGIALQFAAQAKKTGYFEIRDMPELGKKMAPMIKAGIPFNQIFSFFNTLLNKTHSSSEAGTAVSKLFSVAQTTTFSEDQVKAAKSIGLDLSKNDFAGKGEDISSFVRNFLKADKNFPLKSPKVFRKLFESEGAAALANLLADDSIVRFNEGLDSSVGAEFNRVAQFNLNKGSTLKVGRILKTNDAGRRKKASTFISREDFNEEDDSVLQELVESGDITAVDKLRSQISRWIRQNLGTEGAFEEFGLSPSPLYSDSSVENVTRRIRLSARNELKRAVEDPNLERDFLRDELKLKEKRNEYEKAKAKAKADELQLLKNKTGDMGPPSETRDR